MERWKVEDAAALELIGFAGKIGKSGKRPRFRFGPHHKRMTTFLAEIDTALQAMGQGASWLHKPGQSAPFTGKTPLALMVAGGMDGIEKTLEFLHRSVWRSALKDLPRGRHRQIPPTSKSNP